MRPESIHRISVLALFFILGSTSLASAAEADGAAATLQPELQASAYIGLPGEAPPSPRPTEPRLAPLTDDQANAEQRAAIQKYAAIGQDGNVLRTLAWDPQRTDSFFPLFNYLEKDSSVPARDRELLILRTAWLAQCPYMWARHEQRAAQEGLTPAEIRAVASHDEQALGDFDMVLLSLVDELFRNSSITDGTWSALTEAYGMTTAMDAVVTVTQMTESAIVFNTLGIQPDAGTTARLPADVPYAVVAPAKEPALTVARVQPVEGEELAIRRTLRRHAKLADQWYGDMAPIYGNTPSDTASNQRRPELTSHDRELGILRTGWNCQSVYEWAKHVGNGRNYGLEPRDIAIGVAGESWTDRDKALIKAVDEMYLDSMVSDAGWKNLTSIFENTDVLLSFVTVSARYRRVSMTLNALGVQPKPDDERLPVLAN